LPKVSWISTLEKRCQTLILYTLFIYWLIHTANMNAYIYIYIRTYQHTITVRSVANINCSKIKFQKQFNSLLCLKQETTTLELSINSNSTMWMQSDLLPQSTELPTYYTDGDLPVCESVCCSICVLPLYIWGKLCHRLCGAPHHYSMDWEHRPGQDSTSLYAGLASAGQMALINENQFGKMGIKLAKTASRWCTRVE